MANRERGELTVEAGDHAWVLRLTTNAMCELEDRLASDGRPISFVQFLSTIRAGAARDLRLFVWATLLDRQPDAKLEDAGRVLDAAGGIRGFGTTLAQITASLSPDEGDAKTLGMTEARPQKAQAGSGGRASSRTPAKSV